MYVQYTHVRVVVCLDVSLCVLGCMCVSLRVCVQLHVSLCWGVEEERDNDEYLCMCVNVSVSSYYDACVCWDASVHVCECVGVLGCRRGERQ